jgi:hypothetical protein
MLGRCRIRKWLLCFRKSVLLAKTVATDPNFRQSALKPVMTSVKYSKLTKMERLTPFVAESETKKHDKKLNFSIFLKKYQFLTVS